MNFDIGGISPVFFDREDLIGKTSGDFSSDEITKAKNLSLENDPEAQSRRIQDFDLSIKLVDNEKVQDKIVQTKDGLRFILKIFKMVGKGARFIETALKANEVWLNSAQKYIKSIKDIGAVGKLIVDIVSLVNLRRKWHLLPEQKSEQKNEQELLDNEKEEGLVAESKLVTESKKNIENKQKKIISGLAQTGLSVSKFFVKSARLFLEKAHPFRNHLKRIASSITVILDFWTLKELITETRKLAKEFGAIRQAQKKVASDLADIEIETEDVEGDEGKNLKLQFQIRQIFLSSVHMRKWIERAVGNVLEYASCFAGLIGSVGVICVLSGPLFTVAATAAIYLFMISVVFYLLAWAVDSAYFGATDLDAKDPGGERRESLERLTTLNQQIQDIYRLMLTLPKLDICKKGERDIGTLENLLVTELKKHLKDFDEKEIHTSEFNFEAVIQKLEEGDSTIEEVALIQIKDYWTDLKKLYEKVEELDAQKLKEDHNIDVRKLEGELISGLKKFKVSIVREDGKLADQGAKIQELIQRLNQEEETFRKNLFASFCPQGRMVGLKLAKEMEDEAIKNLLAVSKPPTIKKR